MSILQRVLAAIILIAGCLFALWCLIVLSVILWHALHTVLEAIHFGR